jgi:hypothetical protein
VNTRPSMEEIIQILEGLLETNFPPVPVYLKVFDDRTKLSSDKVSY